jgi:hypothetical protein
MPQKERLTKSNPVTVRHSRYKRRNRRVGRTSELPQEWVEAVRRATVPDEFAYLDDELR